MLKHWKLASLPMLVFLTLYHGMSVLEIGVATDLVRSLLVSLSVGETLASIISRALFLVLLVCMFAFSLEVIVEERYMIPFFEARKQRKQEKLKKRCK